MLSKELLKLFFRERSGWFSGTEIKFTIFIFELWPFYLLYCYFRGPFELLAA
jgi:hypothetical protein